MDTILLLYSNLDTKIKIYFLYTLLEHGLNEVIF